MHIRGIIYCYARVSTDHQSFTAKAEQLTTAVCAQFIRETASGARGARAGLKRAIGRLTDGDVLG